VRGVATGTSNITATANTVDSDASVITVAAGETITATVALSTANVKIICPAGIANPRSGYAISGAGTLDLITVSAADVVVEGLQLKHTGATANASGVIATAAAHRLVVRKCVVDDTAIVTTFTGAGVELTSGADDQVVEDCEFLCTKYNVLMVASTTNESDRTVIKGNTMFVGQSAGFAVYAAQATGAWNSPIIANNLIIEADGDGTAATAAWNGTDDTDATQGTFYFGANVLGYLITGNRAYTALSQAFNTLGHISGSATGDTVDSATGTGSDTSSAVTSVGTAGTPFVLTRATDDKIERIKGALNGEVVRGRVLLDPIVDTEAADTFEDGCIDAANYLGPIMLMLHRGWWTLPRDYDGEGPVSSIPLAMLDVRTT
jgi:hypothetical protein